MRRTTRLRRKTVRGAAVELDDIGDSVESGDSDRDTPRSVREKNRQAQRRFRERQKVGQMPGMLRSVLQLTLCQVSAICRLLQVKPVLFAVIVFVICAECN